MATILDMTVNPVTSFVVKLRNGDVKVYNDKGEVYVHEYRVGNDRIEDRYDYSTGELFIRKINGMFHERYTGGVLTEVRKYDHEYSIRSVVVPISEYLISRNSKNSS